MKIGEREERKLAKEGLTEAFNQEFKKMIEYGALVELSDDVKRSWSGPVHYDHFNTSWNQNQQPHNLE